MKPVLQLAFLLHLVATTFAADYTWTFEQEPRQCADLTLSITGTGGKPPYRVLIVPSGANPWSNGTDVRQHFEKHFDGNNSKITFTMIYPANSHFVAVVSDARRFASGGTSVAIPVASSNETSCFNFATPLHPFYFFLVLENQLVQCGHSRIYWPEDKVQGSPNFVGIIPGGTSFEIPSSNKSSEPEGGFYWQPNIREGTTVRVVGGDSRGNGTGGGVENVVNAAPIFDKSCLSNDSPSTTPGTPAGGYPTSASGGRGGAANFSLREIVGIVVGTGGTLIVIAAALFRWWWKKRQPKGRRAILLDSVDDDDEEPLRSSSQNADDGIALISSDKNSTVRTPSIISTLSLKTNHSIEPYAYRPVSGHSVESSAPANPVSPPVPPPISPPLNVAQHDGAGPPQESSDPAMLSTIELPRQRQISTDPREGSGGTRSERQRYPHISDASDG